nr:hypothetical protein [Pseudomonas viridiflava]
MSLVVEVQLGGDPGRCITPAQPFTHFDQPELFQELHRRQGPGHLEAAHQVELRNARHGTDVLQINVFVQVVLHVFHDPGGHIGLHDHRGLAAKPGKLRQQFVGRFFAPRRIIGRVQRDNGLEQRIVLQRAFIEQWPLHLAEHRRDVSRVEMDADEACACRVEQGRLDRHGVVERDLPRLYVL